ncbi:pyruvate kinase [Candidatus Peregrinibacteria bacterium]|nr:pyruvate kinase [Candidatus Peregrinibacteria bacterium]
MPKKNTKIIATLGPSSYSKNILRKMVNAGMNVVRLNFSHGAYSEFKEMIKNVREVSAVTGEKIAIIQDLQGPKLRIGEMPAKGVLIKNGAKIILTTKNLIGNSKIIPIQYKNLPREVKRGDIILIDDGMIELRVIYDRHQNIYCKVLKGGIIKSHKGMNVPGVSIKANPITQKDKRDALFGIKNDVDYIALSFVKSAKDIIRLKKFIKAHRGKCRVIAKIERPEAVKNLKKIIQTADGIMVARGDLGVEMPAETVPLIQKRIIHLANLYGKPVITATQILQSMVENPIATRAEISDAANAVFDHTDAMMLSNETAVGKYPVEAVATLARVAHTVENNLQKYSELLPTKKSFDMPISNATCLNAAKLALDINADMIVAVTLTGFTAQQISRHRLYIPIAAITPDEKVANQLALVWGVNKTIVSKIDFKNAAHDVKKILQEKNLVKSCDEIVIVVNASKDEKLINTIVI